MNKAIDPQLQELVKEHINIIITISSKELKTNEIKTYLGDSILTTENEDTRISFIQSVGSLSAVLTGYFDKRLQEFYDENIIVLNGFTYEIEAKIKDEEFLKRYKEKDEKRKLELLITWQLRTARKLFFEINLFLQRTGFFNKPINDEVNKHGK